MECSTRRIALAALGGLAGLAAGCSSSSLTRSVEVSACGSPYVFTLPSGHQILSGDCAGQIGTEPPTVTIHRGATFSVLITEDNGALGYPVPRPNRPAVKILSEHHATVRYRAVQAGRVLLVAHDTLCLAMDPKPGNCPALAIRVTG